MGAHLARGNMFETVVIRWAQEHGAIVIGLTGTAGSTGWQALGDLFTVLVEAKPIAG